MKHNYLGLSSLIAVNLLHFAQEGQQIQGAAPTQNVEVTRGPKVHRIDAAKMTIGTKSKQSGGNAELEGLPKLPLPQLSLEAVEIDGVPAFKCVTILYGYPILKDKEEFKDGVRTGKVVKQLMLATTRTGVPAMQETEEGRERITIDVPDTDPETGEETVRQFNLVFMEHVYGKAAESVTKRKQNGDGAKNQPAQNQRAGRQAA